MRCGENNKMVKVKCKFCLYEWIARVENPKQCTRCKRYDGVKPIEEFNEKQKEED